MALFSYYCFTMTYPYILQLSTSCNLIAAIQNKALQLIKPYKKPQQLKINIAKFKQQIIFSAINELLFKLKVTITTS